MASINQFTKPKEEPTVTQVSRLYLALQSKTWEERKHLNGKEDDDKRMECRRQPRGETHGGKDGSIERDWTGHTTTEGEGEGEDEDVSFSTLMVRSPWQT